MRKGLPKNVKAEAARLLRAGLLGKDVAEKLGISTATVCHIRKRLALPPQWSRTPQKHRDACRAAAGRKAFEAPENHAPAAAALVAAAPTKWIREWLKAHVLTAFRGTGG